MSALGSEADMRRKTSCPLYLRKRAWADLRMVSEAFGGAPGHCEAAYSNSISGRRIIRTCAPSAGFRSLAYERLEDEMPQ